MNNLISISKLSSGYDLDRGEAIFSIVMRTQSGEQITTSVEADAYFALERALTPKEAKGGSLKLQSGDDKLDAGGAVTFTEGSTAIDLNDEEREFMNQQVAWDDLSDEALHPLMKEAMRMIGVVKVMTLREVYEVAEQLDRDLEKSDWEKVTARLQAKEEAIHMATAVVGGVTNKYVATPPLVTIAAPTPVQVDADPGEVVVGADEDGIPSI